MLRADRHVALEQIVDAACVNGETMVGWADISMKDPHSRPAWWIVSSSFSLCSLSIWLWLDHPREYHGNSVPWQQVDADVPSVVVGAGESDVVAKQHAVAVAVAAVGSDTKLHFVAVVGSTSNGKSHGQGSEDDCYAYAEHIGIRYPVDENTSVADDDDAGERREVAWDTALNGLELPSSVADQDDSRPLDPPLTWHPSFVAAAAAVGFVPFAQVSRWHWYCSEYKHPGNKETKIELIRRDSALFRRTELFVVPVSSSNDGPVLSVFSLVTDMGVKFELEFGVLPADGESGFIAEFCE